jgi:hypothetical protein
MEVLPPVNLARERYARHAAIVVILFILILAGFIRCDRLELPPPLFFGTITR